MTTKVEALATTLGLLAVVIGIFFIVITEGVLVHKQSEACKAEGFIGYTATAMEKGWLECYNYEYIDHQRVMVTRAIGFDPWGLKDE